MKKIILSVFVLFAVSLLSSCSSVTSIDGTWKAPATVAQKYKKIVVLALVNDIAKRSTIEKGIVNNLISNGFNAVSGSSILPPDLIDVDKDGKLDPGAKEIIISKLKEAGIDGAIVSSLEDVQKSTSYVPGTSYYAPGAGMYGFSGYYGGMYNNVYGGGYGRVIGTPGYYVENQNYIVTTNFYNVDSEKLLWSTQSGTINPSSLSDFAKSYGSSVVNAFVSSGVAKK